MVRTKQLVHWIAAALFGSGAFILAEPVLATTLIVSNNNDIVNGDTSSPQALIANPGPDGISLRESIMVVNNGPQGPNTITFAPSLAGQTIALTSQLPLITQAQLTLTGLTSNGQPNLTVDASRVTVARGTLFVVASNFSMSGMRLVGVASTNSALTIRAGALNGPFPPAPQVVRNIRIVGNAFSNAPSSSKASAIDLGRTRYVRVR